MPNKILALQGDPNVGKTGTIIALESLLRRDSGATLIAREYRQSNTSRSDDVFCILEIKGVRIGILSDADSVRVVRYALPEFDKQKCQIIVCAIHNEKDNVCDEINGFASRTKRKLQYISQFEIKKPPKKHRTALDRSLYDRRNAAIAKLLEDIVKDHVDEIVQSSLTGSRIFP